MLPLFTHTVGAALLAAASLTPFTDIYVDQAAPNCASGTGTALAPVCSVNDAIALASAGDTILVAPGTYIGSISLPADLTIRGTEGQDVTILKVPSSGGSVVTIPAGVSGTLEGVTITGGRGVPRGGGVLVTGDLTLRNSTIISNSTLGYMGSFLGGAGIAALDGGSTVIIEDSTISRNRSDSDGGGIGIFEGVLRISNSTITDNRGFAQWYRGGGVFAHNSLVQISNSTFAYNLNEFGVGLYATDPVVGSYVADSTFARNWGRTPGIHVQALGSPPLSLDIRNTLVAGNVVTPTYPVNYPQAEVEGPLRSLGHNLIGTGAPGFVDGVSGDRTGTIASPLDPRIGRLQDNGGPTHTMSIFPDSPAIDAAYSIAFVPFDQRGAARSFGSAPDIGAVEVGSPTPGIDLCNGDGGNQAGCTHCPCGNNAPSGTTGGCLNRAGTSARLHRSGDSSVAFAAGPNDDVTGHPSIGFDSGPEDDLRFSLTGVPPLTFCLLVSGNSIAPTGANAPCFGLDSGTQSVSFDGLRCVVLGIRRHGGRPADANGDVGVTNNPWGGEGAPPIGIAGTIAGLMFGQTRYFQSIYREDALATCMRGLNTSQAVRVVFAF